MTGPSQIDWFKVGDLATVHVMACGRGTGPPDECMVHGTVLIGPSGPGTFHQRVLSESPARAPADPNPRRAGRMAEVTTEDLDLELVRRVQRGDSAAFDLLVRKHQHRVVALIGRYVHD